jgi:putative flippase GtrA
VGSRWAYWSALWGPAERAVPSGRRSGAALVAARHGRSMEVGIAPLAARIPRRDQLAQFLRFCVVGTSGYFVNVLVYAGILGLGVSFRVSACVSFAVSVVSNYLLHRAWTFRDATGPIARQGFRFIAVSLAGLSMNEVWLSGFVAVGVEKIPAQAFACVLVIPVSFLGNRLWAFATPARP